MNRRSGMALAAAALAAMLAPLPGARADGDDVDAARKWVDALPDAGIYTDGYVPHDPPSLMTPEGQQRMIPVAMLEYYARAWRTFLAQDGLTGMQREPQHYKIGHAIDGDTLTIVVQGLLLPRIVDGQRDGIIRVSVGPSMRLHFALGSGRLTDTQLLR